MDQFNLKQKDVYSFDDFMDIKKPSFGGPKSGIQFNAKEEPKQLKKWRRVVTRYAPAENGTFNPNYNGQWRAIGMDRASRDAGIKQEDKSKYIDDLKYGRALPTYESYLFMLENIGDDNADKLTNDSPIYVDKDNKTDIEEYDSEDKKKSKEMDADSAVGEFNDLGYEN